MALKERYLFPAILTKEDKGYSVEFPDLPGCLPSGTSLEEVQRNAREALALHLYGMEKDGETIPEPKEIAGELERGHILFLVDVFMPAYLQEIMNQSVKKTLTIPKWLDDWGKENHVNYSQLLQNALRARAGVDSTRKSEKALVKE